MSLSWRQCAHYAREVQELIATLLRRLDDLDAASAGWIEHDSAADRQLDDESKLDVKWERTMAGVGASQMGFFDALDGFLAAWARLSLLFFPIEGRGGRDGAAFRRDRGVVLREQLRVADDSPLADRDLRDSWMHVDERMDYLLAKGLLSGGLRFVNSRQVGDFIGKVPRLMAVDTRTVYYLKQKGETGSVKLSDLRTVLDDLQREVHDWWRRPPKNRTAPLAE